MTTLTQGGQTSIHSFRMNLVITRFILRFFMIMFIISLGMVFYTKTDRQTLKNNHDYYQAKLISLYQSDLNHEITIKDAYGENIRVTIGSLINNQTLVNSSNKTVNDIKKSLKLSLIISVILTLFLIVYFIKKGTDLGKSKHIRGGSVVKAKLLTRMVKRYNKRTLFMPKLVGEVVCSKYLRSARGLFTKNDFCGIVIYTDKNKKLLDFKINHYNNAFVI